MEGEQLALLREEVRRRATEAAGRTRSRAPGCPGGRRPAARPSRPARSTTSSRRRCTSRRCPAAGSRCGSPGATSTASCRPGRRHRPRGPLAPLRRVVSSEPVLHPAGAAPVARRWPTATPARWPTCCGSPCRRATPGSRRRSRKPAETRLDEPLDTLGRVLVGRTPAARRSSAGSATGESPRAVWTALPGRADWAAHGRGSRRHGGVRSRQPAAAHPTRATCARLDQALDGPARARAATSS